MKASVNKQPVIVNEQRNYEYGGIANFASEVDPGAETPIFSFVIPVRMDLYRQIHVEK